MNKELKILQITARADIGGGPEHLYQLINGSSQKINHFVAAANDFPYFAQFQKLVGDKNCITIPHRKFRLATLLKLKKFVKEHGVTIIHSHGKGAGIYGRLLAMLTGQKSIHTLHGFHVGNYNKLQKAGYILIERILSIFTNTFIAVSEGEKNEIVFSNITSSSKVVVIENGVKVPKNKVDKANYDQTPKNIICFSRFNYQKNTELLLTISKILKEKGKLDQFKFVIYGDGKDFEKIAREIHDKGLKGMIELRGADSDARANLIEGFCYISTSRWEGLPISLLEAMAAGLPVVATNVVGNNNIVDDGETGFLFDLNDPEIAADKIIKLATNYELWKDISEKAQRKIIEHFSLEQMINKIEKIYLS